jgi:small neutral amino acid transporter SnatA (MarC family)
MSVLRAVGQLLYDLVVGDSWPLALAVALLLAAGAGLAELHALPVAMLSLVVAGGLLLVAPSVILIEARRQRPRE